MKTAILAAVSALAIAGAAVPAQSETIWEKVDQAVQDLDDLKAYANLYGYGAFVPSGDSAKAYAENNISNLKQLRLNQIKDGLFSYPGDSNTYTFEEVMEIQSAQELVDIGSTGVWISRNNNGAIDYVWFDVCYGNECNYDNYGNPTNAWITAEGSSADALFLSLVEESFEEGYEAGYKEGFEDGYDVGYRDGFIDGVEYAVGQGTAALGLN